MGFRGAIAKNVLVWGLPFLGLVAAAKTKTGTGPTHDPDQPKARDGAPRPSADKDFQDLRFPCEAFVPAACTAGDVSDWVWTYYEHGILPMQKVAQDLHTQNPDNTDANLLVAQAQAITATFWQTYPGWVYPAPSDKLPPQVPVAPGNEMARIQEINAHIDGAIALRKEMVSLYGKLNQGMIPTGASPADIADQKKRDEIGAGTYAAAGAVVGLGIALAFVVATNKSKRRPRY